MAGGGGGVPGAQAECNKVRRLHCQSKTVYNKDILVGSLFGLFVITCCFGLFGLVA
jgi:hypothetical protein